MINSLKQQLNLIVVAVSADVFFPHKVDVVIRDAGPKEFVSLIKYSSFICASSFHGVAFAIHFRKSFYSIKHPTRNSRMDSLLNKFMLKERQINDSELISNLNGNELFIDYSIIEELIMENTNDSKKWLENNLIKMKQVLSS